jgi:hypothetical protein
MILVFTISTSLFFISCASLKGRGGLNRNGEHSSQFAIEKLVIAEDVKDRKPVGASDIFPAATEKVYCFIEATNIKKDTQIKFVWYRDSKRVHTYKLPLKQGDRWRTYAYKNIYGKKGKWKVEIKDSAGNIIKTASFSVE